MLVKEKLYKKIIAIFPKNTYFVWVSGENIEFFPKQPSRIGFYNRDEKCLQRGTDWVFK